MEIHNAIPYAEYERQGIPILENNSITLIFQLITTLADSLKNKKNPIIEVFLFEVGQNAPIAVAIVPLTASDINKRQSDKLFSFRLDLEVATRTAKAESFFNLSKLIKIVENEIENIAKLRAFRYTLPLTITAYNKASLTLSLNKTI